MSLVWNLQTLIHRHGCGPNSVLYMPDETWAYIFNCPKHFGSQCVWIGVRMWSREFPRLGTCLDYHVHILCSQPRSLSIYWNSTSLACSLRLCVQREVQIPFFSKQTVYIHWEDVSIMIGSCELLECWELPLPSCGEADSTPTHKYGYLQHGCCHFSSENKGGRGQYGQQRPSNPLHTIVGSNSMCFFFSFLNRLYQVFIFDFDNFFSKQQFWHSKIWVSVISVLYVITLRFL